MLIRFQLFFVLFFSFLHVSAQEAPKYSNEFLSIGIGAKSLAMGNSTVASVNDVTAGYWNPAGLLQIKNKYEASVMHAEYFAGMFKYDYAGLSYKINDSSTCAISIIRSGVDDIQNTTDLYDANGAIDYSRISKFSVSDYAFIFSYAKRTKITGLSIAGNAKIIYRNVGEFANAYGFGLDVALQYVKNKWRFGAVLRDATTTFNVWTFNEDELEIQIGDSTFNKAPEESIELTSPKLSLGVARYFSINQKFTLLAEIDLDCSFDGKRNTLIKSDFASIDPKLGLELAYTDFIFVRAGLGNIQEEIDFGSKKEWTFQPNIGIGIKLKNLTIDYALTDIGDNSIALYSNIFSLKYSF